MIDKKKVLVISESSAGQMYLGILLKRIWYEPILAKNVLDGLRHAEQARFSAILLDGDMPDADRQSAVHLLKTGDRGGSPPLIVILPAENGSLSESLLSDGCSAVITKPLDVSLVYGLLGRLSGELRKAPRAPVRMRVEIEERTPASSLFSVNISEGGIYLRTLDPLPESTVLHLTFMLPHDQEKISLAGIVVRSHPLGVQIEEEPGMGINFTVMADDARGRIRNFVALSFSSDLEWESGL